MKVKISINLPEELYVTLEKLQKLTGHKSIDDTVAAALKYYADKHPNNEQIIKLIASEIIHPYVVKAINDCDDTINAVVKDMLDIYLDIKATDDEKRAAADTIIEALCPSLLKI